VNAAQLGHLALRLTEAIWHMLRRERRCRAQAAPAIPAAPTKTFTFLKLALDERVETVGSGTEVRDAP